MAKNIDELKGLIGKLQALLDDPHPGVEIWQASYKESVRELLKFWGAVPAADAALTAEFLTQLTGIIDSCHASLTEIQERDRKTAESLQRSREIVDIMLKQQRGVHVGLAG